MATNYIQPGDVITIISAGAVTSGAPIMVGDLPGVALNAAAGSGDTVDVALTGVFTLAKVSANVLTIGERVYLASGEITDSDGSGANPAFGHAFEAAGNGVTTVKVRLG